MPSALYAQARQRGSCRAAHCVNAVDLEGMPPDALPAAETVESYHQLELDPLPRLVSVARSFVTEHLPMLDPSTHDVVVLLTSELVTNVVIHARTAIRIGVVVTRHVVVVTVHDLDLGRAEQLPTAREGGRGLMLVEALAQGSGMHYNPGDGKTAWFRVERAAPTEVHA
jgi:anti-sigma regulatory factor (Ser/Thr protein kinase)